MPGAVKSVAIVTPYYPPHLGGVERHAQEFARAASRLGLAVNVITTAQVARPVEVFEDDRIRVLRLPAHNVPVMGSHFPIGLRGWSKAEPLLDCDVVLAHTRFFLTTLLAAKTVAYKRRRICVLDHGSGPLRASPRLFALVSLMYERYATSTLKRFGARFFAISGASAEWLREFGVFDAPIIPNGIGQRAQMPPRRTEAFERPVIFFAGRLLPEKGIRELVQAVESLARDGRDVRLRIAGDGPLAGYLSQRAATGDVVTYLGPLSPAQVANELDNATLFVNPSNYPEGLPTILLEAATSALPVISTPRGGSIDLIKDGETGWLITKGEPREIVRCIGDVLARPAEALRRGANLFELVQNAYTWPSIVHSFFATASERADD